MQFFMKPPSSQPRCPVQPGGNNLEQGQRIQTRQTGHDRQFPSGGHHKNRIHLALIFLDWLYLNCYKNTLNHGLLQRCRHAHRTSSRELLRMHTPLGRPCSQRFSRWGGSRCNAGGIDVSNGEELGSNPTLLCKTPQLLLRATAAVVSGMSAGSSPKYRWCGPQGHSLVFGVVVDQHGNENNDKMVVHTEVRQSCWRCCRSLRLLLPLFLWRRLSVNLLPTVSDDAASRAISIMPLIGRTVAHVPLHAPSYAHSFMKATPRSLRSSV